MLIENAFLKLPELILSSFHHGGNVEAMIVNHLATGIQMELNCRSVPFAYNHVTVEKPYPNNQRKGTVFRADLFFDSDGSVPGISHLEQYGFKKNNWIEAKTFFGGKKTAPAKTQNNGKIIKDILRLCLYLDELQGKHRLNARYILLVFNQKPSFYLAYSQRPWLKNIFEDKVPEIEIDLNKEPKTCIRSIVNCDSINANIKIKFSKLYFEPIVQILIPVYWGYLLRIDSFYISINGKTISYSKDIDDYWSHERIQCLGSVKKEFTGLLLADETDITNQ
jgi:hypothetical protein